MYPVFSLLGLDLPAYGVMAFLGLAFAFFYIFWRRNKDPNPVGRDDLLYLSLFALIGILVGAKLLYLLSIAPLIVSNFPVLIEQPQYIIELLQNGFVFYGGLLGAIFMIWVYCRKYQLSGHKVFALVTPAFPLFHAFGRVGCFLAGCCYGAECSWGVAFTHSVSAPNGIPLFPVQLAEAVCNLLLFVVLAALSRRLGGKVLPLYLVSYSVLRFALEFLRGDVVRGVFFLSTSQWVALFLIAGSLFYLVKTRNFGPKDPEERITQRQ